MIVTTPAARNWASALTTSRISGPVFTSAPRLLPGHPCIRPHGWIWGTFWTTSRRIREDFFTSKSRARDTASFCRIDTQPWKAPVTTRCRHARSKPPTAKCGARSHDGGLILDQLKPVLVLNQATRGSLGNRALPCLACKIQGQVQAPAAVLSMDFFGSPLI